MLDSFMKIFSADLQEEEVVMKSDAALAAGVILMDVAFSDSDFSTDERDMIIDVLKKDFGLSEAETADLIEIAGNIVKEDTNRYRYMKIINDSFSKDEKKRLIKNVWKIIYADERLDMYEDRFVHKLSKILHIPHGEMIDMKLEAAKQEGTE